MILKANNTEKGFRSFSIKKCIALIIRNNTLLFFLQGARCEEQGPFYPDHGKYTMSLV